MFGMPLDWPYCKKATFEFWKVLENYCVYRLKWGSRFKND